jgi:hypothetical protein
VAYRDGILRVLCSKRTFRQAVGPQKIGLRFRATFDNPLVRRQGLVVQPSSESGGSSTVAGSNMAPKFNTGRSGSEIPAL